MKDLVLYIPGIPVNSTGVDSTIDMYLTNPNLAPSNEISGMGQTTNILLQFNVSLTYLQENFKPVAHRSASVEVFDEEDAQVVHPLPSFWGCQGT